MEHIKQTRSAAVLWKVHVALIIVQVGYGGSYVLSKVALSTGVSPIVFAVYRDIVCLLVLVPTAYLTERGMRVPLAISTLIQLVGLGFFGAFITQLLVLYGLTLTSAAYTSTVSVLTPLFTFIISVSLGYEQIRWRRWDGQAKLLGLVSAVSGAVILGSYMGPVILGNAENGVQTMWSSEIGPAGLLEWSSRHLKIEPWHLGILFLFLAGLTLSISISMQVPILARYPAPISVSAFAYFFGAIMLFLSSLITNKSISAWVISETAAVISIIYNGLIPAALNFTMLVWCVQKSGPVLVGAYIPLQLFSSAAMAYVFLGEGIRLGCVLGTLLIINGLGFITWGQVHSRNVTNLEVRASPLDSTGVITAVPFRVCDPYSNPMPQELLQLLPHPEWSVHGYRASKGEGWVGDSRTWELDVGGLSSRLFFYQDPGTPPAIRKWPSFDVGTEIYISDQPETAEWVLSDFNVLVPPYE